MPRATTAQNCREPTPGPTTANNAANAAPASARPNRASIRAILQPDAYTIEATILKHPTGAGNFSITFQRMN